jgi:F0F1-type ATP synthase beta subunit
VQFDGKLPEIYNALELKRENGDTLVLEVNSTLGGQCTLYCHGWNGRPDAWY